jgi:hypothetical protein
VQRYPLPAEGNNAYGYFASGDRSRTKQRIMLAIAISAGRSSLVQPCCR